jgi:hypothetical protein
MNPEPNNFRATSLQEELYKLYEVPNLYLDLKKKRFIFKKVIKGQRFMWRRYFKHVKKEDDFWLMVRNWMSFLAQHGDEVGQTYMKAELLNDEVEFYTKEEERYCASPRPSTWFDKEESLDREYICMESIYGV